jgi:hypothetical protein
MASRISYYAGPTHGRNNAEIVVMIGAWPPRVLDRRGFTRDRMLSSRAATHAEELEIASSPRYLCQRYQSVEALLEDERRILERCPSELESLVRALAEK